MTQPKPFRNVCEVIVANDYCIGCGVCAGICPAHVLEMEFNDFGEYQPIEKKEGCLPKCDLCLRGCPFWNQDDNEDTYAQVMFGTEPGIKHCRDTGYYLECYAGYSNVDDHRVHGASGGMATWLLETLLKEKFVDYVICVTHNPSPEKLYKFVVLNSVEEIRSASRSCYYPVELSEVIEFILQNEGRYAIIGLPCFIKGIRLAARSSVKLKRRITFLVGLVCGQMKSTYFSAYLCALKGGDPRYMNYCQFRIKDAKRDANDFGFAFNCTKGSVQSGTIFWKEGMDKVWINGFFKLNACNYCDDVFAELADVVLMDAWLDRYIKDPKGTNLILFRNSTLRDIVLNGSTEGEMHLELSTIEDVIQSQQAVINIKRNHLAHKLQIAKVLGQKYLPEKRVKPSVFNPISLLERFLEQNVTKKSKQVMARYGTTEGITKLNRATSAPLYLLRLISGIRSRLKISYLLRQINRFRIIKS